MISPCHGCTISPGSSSKMKQCLVNCDRSEFHKDGIPNTGFDEEQMKKMTSFFICTLSDLRRFYYAISDPRK